MMRVLHIVSAFASGGCESFVRDLAISLNNTGTRCAVAALSTARSMGHSEDFEATYVEKLHANGVDTFILDHRKNVIKGGIALAKVCREVGADIVHVHLARAVVFRLFAPIRIPTVYTYHTTKLLFPKLLFHGFDRVVSQYVAICGPTEELLRGITKRPVSRIHNGVCEARVPSDLEKEGRFTVISVGVIRPEKNYEMVLRIAQRFEKLPSGPRPFFRIIGGGAGFAELKKKVDSQGLGKSIELLGTRTDVESLLQKSHLYLLTSTMEGFPIALLEACRAGLPIVASNVGGVSEIVEDGSNGYLVESNSEEKYLAAITILLNNAEIRLKMSEMSKIRSEIFSISRASKSHQTLYAALLS